MTTTTAPKKTPKHEQAQASHAKRNRDIVARLRKGESLSEIGERYGLTSERVRQISLPEFGNDKAEFRRVRAEAVAKRQRDERIKHAKEYAKENKGATVAAIARAVGGDITADDISELLGPRESYRRESYRFRDEPSVTIQFSDEDCLEALRKASKKVGRKGEYGVLTMNGYKDAAGVHAPDKCTIQKRFGTWKAACKKAGVPCGAPGRAYSRKWTDKELRDIVKRFFLETGFIESPARKGSMNDYRVWAQQNPDVPKTPTIRSHFGSWTKVKQIGEALIPKGKKPAVKN